MKIEYITDIHIDEPTAPAHHVISTCKAFVTLGNEVMLVHPSSKIFKKNKGPSLLNHHISYWYPKIRGGWRLYERLVAYYLKHHQKLKPIDADIMYIRFTPSKHIIRALSNISIPKVLELNGIGDCTLNYFRDLIESIDLVLIDSPERQKIISQCVPAHAHKIAIHLSPATESDHFRPLNKSTCRKNLGLASHSNILLLVSGFQQQHDLLTAISAIKMLNKKGNKYTLILIGDGPKRQEVFSVAAELIADKQVFMPGVVSYENLPAYIGAADICLNLLTTWKLKEGNLRAYKLYEYVSCARPVIETADFDLPIEEWARKTLFLIQPESPFHLCDAVANIEANPSLMNNKCELGRRYIIENRSWQAAARSSLEKLHTLCSHNHDNVC